MAPLTGHEPVFADEARCNGLFQFVAAARVTWNVDPTVAIVAGEETGNRLFTFAGGLVLLIHLVFAGSRRLGQFI